MTRLILIFMVFGFFLGCSTSQIASIDNPESEVKKISLEFRFVEQNPEIGLIQKTVKGSLQTVFLQDEILFSNSDVGNAYVVNVFNNPAVGITFNEKSAKKFYDVTKNNINRSIAILLDSVVVSVSQIKEPISNGKSVIVGEFKENQANKIVSGILKD